MDYKGGPLIIEQLDLKKIGIYSEEEKAKLIADGVDESDFVMKFIYNGYAWLRLSEKGIKWQTYESETLAENPEE